MLNLQTMELYLSYPTPAFLQKQWYFPFFKSTRMNSIFVFHTSLAHIALSELNLFFHGFVKLTVKIFFLLNSNFKSFWALFYSWTIVIVL